MTIQLDHIVVAAKDPIASAKFLGEMLGVEWEESDPLSRYSPVYVNEGLTVDFAKRESFPTQHYCFRVPSEEFEPVRLRLDQAGVTYRSGGTATAEPGVNYRNGGMNIWWNDADGHLWELLTVSYARNPDPAAAAAAQ
jgi:catechol 2,3-dioxygenase-like lactoylglutathione lyase family enzyme